MTPKQLFEYEELESSLRWLFSGVYNKILIVGIGNYLRSDDGAGVRIVSSLTPTRNIALLNAETNIERYIVPIQRSNVDLILFIDCVDFGKPPGFVGIVETDIITDYSFTSHNISLVRIREFFKVPSYVLGIQPETLRVGESLSPKVQASVNHIIRLLQVLTAAHIE